MRSIKLYGTGSATANAAAQITIPSKGKIVGIQVGAMFDCTTDTAQCTLEVSRASARETAVNGAQQCIAEVSIYSNFVTSGLSQPGINTFLPVDVEVDQGQIIYLHALIAGVIVYYGTFLIWIK